MRSSARATSSPRRSTARSTGSTATAGLDRAVRPARPAPPRAPGPEAVHHRREAAMTEHRPQTHELKITRVFDAPRELVFRCMIDARAPHPLLGAGRHEHAAREHHDRAARRRSLRDDHGERRDRRGVPEPRRVRRGGRAREARVERARVRHHLHAARSPISATAAPRCTSTRPTCPSSSPRPRPRPASTAPSTASRPTSPRCEHPVRLRVHLARRRRRTASCCTRTGGSPRDMSRSVDRLRRTG